MPLITNRSNKQPLYMRIKQEIAERITRAELMPGDTLPTHAALAEHYNTTRATIGHALQEMVREGLLIGGSGRRIFVAHPPERPAASVAVVWDWPEEVTRTAGEFLDPLCSGIRQACAEFMLEVHYRSQFTSFAEVLSLTRAQGLLVLRPNYDDIPHLKRLRGEGVPVVSVPAILDDDLVPSVASDNFQGMEQAVAHLAALGHRDIGLISMTATIPDHFERVQGFLRAMVQQGLPVNPAWEYLAHDIYPRLYAQRAAEWLEAENLPTAFVVSDFGQALTVLRRLNELGVNVPRDVSLVCFDDPPMAGQLVPALTVVRQDVFRLGYRAMERLVESIGGRSVPMVDRISTELIVRESTAPPRR